MTDSTSQADMESLDPEITNMRESGAFLLDFFTIFFVSGFFAAQIDNGTFGLGGESALIAASITVLYFVLGKYAGGTIWQRIIRMK